MANSCTCRLTSDVGAFPPTFDNGDCPTHGPNAPRYFVDHGTIHDRVTGKHVETDDACRRLNDTRNALAQLRTRALMHAPGSVAEFSPSTAVSLAMICEEALREP